MLSIAAEHSWISSMTLNEHEDVKDNKMTFNKRNMYFVHTG